MRRMRRNVGTRAYAQPHAALREFLLPCSASPGRWMGTSIRVPRFGLRCGTIVNPMKLLLGCKLNPPEGDKAIGTSRLPLGHGSEEGLILAVVPVFHQFCFSGFEGGHGFIVPTRSRCDRRMVGNALLSPTQLITP